MSHPPNPPESQEPESQSPTPEAAASMPPSGGPPVPPARRSAITAAIIGLLRFKIFVLEKLLEVLKSTLGRLEGTPASLATPSPSAVSPSAASTTPPQPASQDWLGQTIRVWLITLRFVRSFLPASFNQKLSDLGLSGVIAATVVILLWTTTNALLPAKPAAEVATLPISSPEIKTPPESLPPVLPGEPLPDLSPGVTLPKEKPVEAPKKTPGRTLPNLIAPDEPQSLEFATPQLTPEQALIASIQTEVKAVMDQYGGGLVQSIQANFPESLLLVTVSNDWYDLTESQQNKLADEMLRQAQSLDFSKLEIKDNQEALVARSPVIGSEMVILQRRFSDAV